MDQFSILLKREMIWCELGAERDRRTHLGNKIDTEE